LCKKRRTSPRTPNTPSTWPSSSSSPPRPRPGSTRNGSTPKWALLFVVVRAERVDELDRGLATAGGRAHHSADRAQGPTAIILEDCTVIGMDDGFEDRDSIPFDDLD